MGYTHYFPQNRAFTLLEWTKILAAFETIWNYCTKQGVVLRFECDTCADPQWDNSAIRFNGVGEEGHETFYIQREFGEQFRFCKTAQKSYDLAVCLILLAFNEMAPGALTISSDGDWDGDWAKARKAYKMLFHNEPACPFEVEEDGGEGGEGGDCDSDCGVSCVVTRKRERSESPRNSPRNCQGQKNRKPEFFLVFLVDVYGDTDNYPAYAAPWEILTAEERDALFRSIPDQRNGVVNGCDKNHQFGTGIDDEGEDHVLESNIWTSIPRDEGLRAFTHDHHCEITVAYMNQ